MRRWNRLAPLSDGPLANLVWQAAVGAWPIERDRLHAYAEKAAREAGVSTTWIDSDGAFEERLHALVGRRLRRRCAARRRSPRWPTGSGPFGWSNSLSAKLIQLTAPGVPDVYQGTELWDLSLVDPDNRRPVDYRAPGGTAGRHRRRLAAGDRRRGRGQAAGDQLGRCGCAGTARNCSPGTPPSSHPDRPQRTVCLRPRRGTDHRHPAAGRTGSSRAVGADTAVELPAGSWTDALTGRAVQRPGAGRRGAATDTRSPCWCENGE